MRFAVLLPWWGYALAFGSAAGFGWLAYARVPLPGWRWRAVLSGLRALTLIGIVAILLRPVHDVPAGADRGWVLPILVDVSRSMRMADTGDATRLERAAAIARDLSARAGSEYRVELLTYGESLATADLARLAPTARRSDLSGALSALADRHRGERMAGVVVLSDGGETLRSESDAAARLGAPVTAVGVGSPTDPRDREVVNLTAGEPLLPGASIDLSVSAVSHGYGTEPVELRVSANGRPVDVRRVVPAADGAPLHAVITVSPEPKSATVYTVEIPAASGEVTVENNVRSVLVPPQTAHRRILIVEGAPGFEHTFFLRALTHDPGLEVDAVVRKGRSDDGRDTFFVQADTGRVASLAAGYPGTRAELYGYDAIVLGNIEADYFTSEQLAMTADFVGVRGGGLLVLGAKSFERQGLAGTALDEVLPVDPSDRSGAVARVSAGSAGVVNTATLTADGLLHPATRLAPSTEESRKRWADLPPLAAVMPVGGARPGAQVLAASATPGGETLPLFVAQRYGQGRSMVFAGEASWRWRMMRPSSDTSYETIWRQVARWLAMPAPGHVTIAPMAPAAPGVPEPIQVTVRGADFAPAGDAVVRVTVTAPDGETQSLVAPLERGLDGRYAVSAPFDQPGVYRVDASAFRGGQAMGAASLPVLVGGADLEMSEPRLDEAVLRHVADASGGHYVPEAEAGRVPALLRAPQDDARPPEVRDLWHNGWSLLGIVTLLAAEWLVRRRVGLA